MIGVVKDYFFECGYGFLITNHGDLYVHWATLPVDNLGRSYLVKGEEVEYEVGKNLKGPCAKNVRVLSERTVEDPKTYWEEGFVERVMNYGAILRRPSGGFVFLHNEKVNSDVTLALGQVWRYQINPPIKESSNWLAVRATMLEDENGQTYSETPDEVAAARA